MAAHGGVATSWNSGLFRVVASCPAPPQAHSSRCPTDLFRFELIQAIYKQPHAIAGTLQVPFPSLSSWESRFEKAGDMMQNLVAIVDGKVAGQLGLHFCHGHRRKHVASFGMAVCASFLRQGVGKSLLGAVIDSCDNWLNISRIELEVYVDNESAIGLYKSFGFEIEGCCRNYAYKAGKLTDVYLMARLRD